MTTIHSDTSGHQCPGPLCTKIVGPEYLACGGHWYQVSKTTRIQVWRAWNNGNGAGADAHRVAMTNAISEMRPFKADILAARKNESEA